MDKNELKNEREELFDEDFKHKSDDIERLAKFGQTLKDITNVQVCTSTGSTYEYLPQVYRSAINKI